MDYKDKDENAYKTIGEVTKEVGLVNKKTGKLQTHTIRYWESQFNQIKPSVKAGGRRYYSSNILKIIKYVKFLLKDRGLTISGAKKILNNQESDSIDDDEIIGINKSNFKDTKNIKQKIKNISKIVKELKKIK